LERNVDREYVVIVLGCSCVRTRTSSNAWDIYSSLAKRFKQRSFDLLGMDADITLEDGLQVLNYKPSQYYKPHVDWLNPGTPNFYQQRFCC
jgi:hypothetical protein